MNKPEKPIAKTCFLKGWSKVRQCDVANIRKELQELYGVRTMRQFRARQYGTLEMTVSEAQSTKEIFAKYGVTNIWGLPN